MKLQTIQQQLNVPKGQRNTFGNYNYRSCEDILSALKPLLKEQGCTLVMEDEIIAVGGRVYVKATVTLMDGEAILGRSMASAREAEDKKGMDAAQITGAASSYARKYALAGLFLIDDGVEPDKTNRHGNTEDDTRTMQAVNKSESLKVLGGLWKSVKEQGQGKKYAPLVMARLELLWIKTSKEDQAKVAGRIAKWKAELETYLELVEA